MTADINRGTSVITRKGMSRMADEAGSAQFPIVVGVDERTRRPEPES